MNNNYLFVGGEFYQVPEGDNVKAITTIPGWAEAYNRRQRKTPAATRYLKSPTAFTCVQMRARALSAIEWDVFAGENPVPDNHPLKKLLREVNHSMNWVDLVRATEADMLIHGKAYWLKLGEGNRTYYIQRLSPPDITVKTGSDGIIGYEQKVGSGKPAFFERDQVMYFHDYSPIDEYMSVAPMDVAADAIDMEIQSSQYINAFFSNSAIPPLILTTENKLVDADYNRIQAWIRKTFGGVKNQHKVGIMGSGLKAQVIGYPLKDLAMQEVRAEARRDICAALSVPPAIAGAWEAANYATATEQHRSLYEDTIIPRASYLAAVINAELVPEFGSNLEFIWKTDELPIMQADANLEAQRLTMLVNAGIIRPDVAAIEAGFSDTDVPEPAPAPEGDTDMQTALNKWQRKAENSLSKGKGAQVDFESAHIPPLVNDAIHKRLGAVKSRTDLSRLFGEFG